MAKQDDSIDLRDFGPSQYDVDNLTYLLKLTANFRDADQRARYILSSNWYRQRPFDY